MKRMINILLVIALILVSITANAEGAKTKADLYPFTIRNASVPETSKKIAITMDDCYDIDKVDATIELCRQYGVNVTFFPLGQILKPKDREVWQKAIDSGCEIGSHTYYHNYLDKLQPWTLIWSLGKTQQVLDETLGYHYQIRWVRPPFGRIKGTEEGATSNRVVGCMRKMGYEHVVLWNVSQTDPTKAMKQIKPGCIALYHARNKDVHCLEEIIPQLIEQGYEMITVSELLGYEAPETSDQLYVYDKKNYQ